MEIYATSVDYDPKAEVSVLFFKRVQNKIHYAVSGYLDFAERQAEREIPMTMKDWSKHLDGILTSTGENVLTGNGTVSHIQGF